MKTSLKILLLATSAALVGCGPALFLSALSLPPEVLSGNETGLTVRIHNVNQEADATKMADEHCSQYDRISKGISRNKSGMAIDIIYECVSGGVASRSSSVSSDNSAQPTIQKIQMLLNQHGYECGIADGIAGPKTTEAIKQYQADTGLLVDGRASPELLARLESEL